MCELGLGGCLADDMGLGKTVQVIALHLHRRSLEAGPTLVVCPTSLLGNWERELARFAPDVPVRRYHGGDRHLEELAADEVVLVTYGVVRRDRAVLAEVGWGLVVADEAQHAKNPLSRTARELRAIQAPARVALTGTPVENRLTELWSILDWTTPGLLGPLERFRRSLAVPVERYRDAAATERLARMVRPFLLRRRKSDPRIAPELPAKTETDRVVPLTPEQATLYEAVVRETLAKIAASEGIERRGLVLGLLTALKQICNHPAQYLHEAAPLPGRSGKLAALDELLDVILAEGEAALVFSQYVEMCRLIRAHLADRGVPTLFLHGRVPARRREELVARFQDGGAAVFLLSLKAGGVGLNLTRATHVVHYDRWWNPAVEDQATDRAYRIGQDRPVQVHRLVTEGTLEDRIAALLASKRGLAEAVVGAGEAWITELSDAELAELVSLQRTP
jgi:SNF2 family DNA or RNA helicase